MNIPRGDFIGFTVDGIHSSELGIIRVSDGSRFSMNLLPDFSDKTVNIPGGDGIYYFGREYTSRSFDIAIAYDNLQEWQIRKIKQLFFGKRTHELIFDEYPYKIYDVVLKSSPQLKFLCFDDEFGNRIYKGEGTLNFISYSSCGKTKYKYIEDYSGTATNSLPDEIPSWYNRDSNLDEWLVSSGIISKQQTVTAGGLETNVELDEFGVYGGYRGVYVYNPGDTSTPFKIAAVFPDGGTFNNFSISLREKTSQIRHSLVLDSITAQGDDTGILIDMGTGVIAGSTGTTAEEIFSTDTTGNLYNSSIISGDFFYVPNTNEIEFLFCSLQAGNNEIGIQYNYLYL